MYPIYVFPPNTLKNQQTGESYTKYTACVHTMLGPYGFGDTPKEAIAYMCDKYAQVKEEIK